MPNSGKIIEQFIGSRHIVIVETDLSLNSCNYNNEYINYSNKIAFYKNTGNSYQMYKDMYFPFLGINKTSEIHEYLVIDNNAKKNKNLDFFKQKFELCEIPEICIFMNTYFACYDHLRISAALGGGEWDKTYKPICDLLLQYDNSGNKSVFKLETQPKKDIIIKPLLNIENYEMEIEINKYMIKYNCVRSSNLNDVNNIYIQILNDLKTDYLEFLKTKSSRSVNTNIKVPIPYEKSNPIYFLGNIKNVETEIKERTDFSIMDILLLLENNTIYYKNLEKGIITKTDNTNYKIYNATITENDDKTYNVNINNEVILNI